MKNTPLSLKKNMTKISNYKRGVWAEYIAAVILIFKGYRVLELRAKTKLGEIDILASKAKTLIAIEVKTSHSYDHASYKIDAQKRTRVTNALQYLSSQNQFIHYQSYRFDAFILTRFKFYHIINAW